MNWDAIGAAGEILGASAVFVSLIYLSIQIRGQTKESQLNAMHDISAGMREIISRFFSPDALPILIKANENYEQLTDEEAMRFVALCGQYFLAWEEAFIQHQESRLADRNWKSLSKYFSNGMGLPGVQKAWILRKNFFDEEFVKYVDSGSTIEYKAR